MSFKNQKVIRDFVKFAEKIQTRKRYKKAEILNKIHAGDLYKVKEIVCKECGKKILTAYDRTFCSTSSRCPMCNTLLIEKGNNTGRGYCSEECKQKKRLKDAIEAGNYVPCEYCGKKFIRKNYSNRFCSKECFKNWTEKEKQKKIAKYPVKPAVQQKKCEWCGKLFTVTNEKRGQKYCSLECRKAKNKSNKRKDKEKTKQNLNIGKELHICTICKTHQMDCERFTSNFVYSPKGLVGKIINNKHIIISCPKFTE